MLAQAKYKVKAGSLHCKRVIVPGVFIDAVVICPNPEEDHRQTHSFYMDPAYCGDTKAPVSSDDVLPISLRKVIGRRALMELSPDDVLNVGTGIPNDVVGPIITEEGMSEDVTITVESGIYGGIPMGGIDFGIAKTSLPWSGTTTSLTITMDPAWMSPTWAQARWTPREMSTPHV